MVAGKPATDPSAVHIFEAIVVSLVSVALIGAGILSFAIAPYVTAKRSAKLEAPTVVGKKLPSESGSIQIVGRLRKNGRALPNTNLVLLFGDNQVSESLRTDAEGKFHYTLPPGSWKFVSPYVIGASRDLSFRFDTPRPGTMNGSTIFVVTSGPIQETYAMSVDLH
jgi:hypothetical protein